MDKAIKKIESKMFSDEDIMELLEGKTKIVRYKDLKKFKNVNDLFYPYDNIFLLYEFKPNMGHWVCLIKNKNYIEFFDPTGTIIDEQLDYIDDDFKKRSNQDKKHLSNLIAGSGLKVLSNKYKLQKTNKDTNTCGRHCLIRVILKKLNLKEYLNLFKNNKLDPDTVVSYLTAFK